MLGRDSAENVTAIIRDAGGNLVGKTRLQKIAYLLEASGYGNGFQFIYHYYGPYSEQVADATSLAQAQGLLTEIEKQTQWGTSYSIYKTKEEKPHGNSVRNQLITIANEANAIDLELAATAIYLAKQGSKNPWKSTENLKQDKAQTHLSSAKELYKKLHRIAKKLPEIK